MRVVVMEGSRCRRGRQFWIPLRRRGVYCPPLALLAAAAIFLLRHPLLHAQFEGALWLGLIDKWHLGAVAAAWLFVTCDSVRRQPALAGAAG